MLIPGGPHIEQLKKGDIIFNAAQTEDLIRRGKTYTPGRVAHADGTAYNMLNAHASRNTKASGSGTIKRYTGGSSSSAATTANTAAVNKNTGATNNAAKATNKAAGGLDKFKEWTEKLYDWIEVRIDRFSSSIDNLAQKAENLVGYAKKNAEVNKEMKLTGTGKETYSLKMAKAIYDGVQRVTGIKYKGNVKGTQIDNNLRGAERYFQQAEQVRKKGISTGVISAAGADNVIGKIQSGMIQINEYNEQQRAFIDSYKEWYDKAMDCVYAVDELKASLKELEQTKLDNIIEDFEGFMTWKNAVTTRDEAFVKYLTFAGQVVNGS